MILKFSCMQRISATRAKMHGKFIRFVTDASGLHKTNSEATVYSFINLRHCYHTSTSDYKKLDHEKFTNLRCCQCQSSVPIQQNTQKTFSFVRTFSTAEERCYQSLDYINAKDKDVYDILAKDMLVQKDFISEEEENSLFDEAERYIKRLRYEFDHWDNAIHGFREIEKKSWNEKNSKIIERVKDLAFGTSLVPLPYVHVLDISKEGYIKPHVDAVRFCGDTIAGMCLLSSCVMRLALEKDSSKYGDIYLPRRCLYIMKNTARYEFTHEVLKEGLSVFKNEIVPRDRRISIICRCEPNPANIN